MATSTVRVPLFLCGECGRKFFSTAAAERASWDGCPGCGGGDIDIAPAPRHLCRSLPDGSLCHPGGAR